MSTPRARQTGLLTQPIGEQLVVFDRQRHRLHLLNRTAALVWRHCDGRRTGQELASLVGSELGSAIDESVVTLALDYLQEAHLLEAKAPVPADTAGLSRRSLLKRAAAVTAGVLLP